MGVTSCYRVLGGPIRSFNDAPAILMEIAFIKQTYTRETYQGMDELYQM
jgi:hypothetical protein